MHLCRQPLRHILGNPDCPNDIVVGNPSPPVRLSEGSSAQTTTAIGGSDTPGGGTQRWPAGTTQWLEIPAIPIPAFPVIRPARPPAPQKRSPPGKPARPDGITEAWTSRPMGDGQAGQQQGERRGDGKAGACR